MLRKPLRLAVYRHRPVQASDYGDLHGISLKTPCPSGFQSIAQQDSANGRCGPRASAPTGGVEVHAGKNHLCPQDLRITNRVS